VSRVRENRMHGSMWRELETEQVTWPWSLGWDNHPGNRGRREGPRTYRQEKQPRQFPTLLTHICAKSRAGRFWVKRITIAKRMRAKLAEVKDQLRRRRHDPIPVQGRWLAQLLQGHMAYYAVPGSNARNLWVSVGRRTLPTSPNQGIE